MLLSDFADARPYLFHLTSGQNLGRIRRLGLLQSARELLTAAGREDLLRTRRNSHEEIFVGHDLIQIRDQAPLFEGNIEFDDGMSFEDLIELLNSHVFFWPGGPTGPIDYAVRHYDRYRVEAPILLRVPLDSMIAVNQGLKPLFCSFNSGSPRCSGRRKSPRGRGTFLPAVRYHDKPARVVEVTFGGSVRLPPDCQIALRYRGPWQPLFDATGVSVAAT